MVKKLRPKEVKIAENIYMSKDSEHFLNLNDETTITISKNTKKLLAKYKQYETWDSFLVGLVKKKWE
jgi:hypothetical protein